MTHQKGFTLIELVFFIVILAILGSTILMGFVTALQKYPSVHQNVIALQTAKQCMEWFIGQRRLQGYSTLACNTTVPTFCTTPANYSITTNVSCIAINSDNNYKSITVTVSGLGDASLTSLIADY